MSIHDFPLRPDPMARLAAAVSLAPPPRVGLGAWDADLADDLAEATGYARADLAEALDDGATLLRDQMTFAGNAAAEMLDAIRARMEVR